ncbi:MAG: GNAT family N-acetyltransferase [Bacteroidota bacterium]|jgi:hypothetical protein
MNPLINPVELSILKSELNDATFLRTTNNGSNHIYDVNIHNAPNTLREIGRLRELTFREAGGGTGLDCDLDELDTCEKCYNQLVVWNPEDQEIVGGYRYIRCGDAAISANGEYHLATTELFHFSEKFKKDFLPFTIELGRSFVQPKYQPRPENRKGLFSLDNLWDGLGALVIENPDIKYFFGKVTMYRHFNLLARDYILSFMQHYFSDPDQLVTPIHSLPITSDVTAFINEIKNLDYKEGHKILNVRVRGLGENIPPLINSYMNLSPTMRTFGTSLNEHFGDVEETGILVTLKDMYESKVGRHINTYIKGN